MYIMNILYCVNTKQMNVIYMKGELSFWIIQHNLFTYILLHTIFKSLSISYVYQSFYDPFCKQLSKILRC